LQGSNGKKYGRAEERVESMTLEQVGDGDPASNPQSGKELQE